MKKCIFLCAVLVLLTPLVGGEGIVRDYYLRNREYAVMRERVNVLPNTLRLELTCGEYGSLRADVTPDKKLAGKLSWRLMKNTGAIAIYPSGDTCSVYGISAGEETVEVSLGEERSVQVEVAVSEPKEIRLRSFELEREKERESLFSESLVLWMTRSLVIASLAILCTVGILIMRRGGKK